jgi:hypothetical protein
MKTEHDPSQLSFLYSLKVDDQWFQIHLLVQDTPSIPDPESRDHYFKEHEWGFGRDGQGKTKFYRVKHPVWRTYPIESVDHNLDFGRVYGQEWEFLNDSEPLLAVFAEGSDVEVFPNQDIAQFE